MMTLPSHSKICTEERTALTCSWRDRCARHVEIKDADKTARIDPSLCPGRDDYWPHFVHVEAVQ